jgi:leucyl aminopeptidase
VQKGCGVKSITSVALSVDGGWADGMVAAAAEGAHVAAYTDDRYRQKKTAAEKVPSQMVLLGLEKDDIAPLTSRGIALAAGIITTKEVVASPANYLNPANMADAARQIAKEEGMTIKVLGRAECAELGMGSFLGVAQGASSEPHFIHMTYSPADGVVNKKIAIVGKSVCHDTGGYNLKAGPGSMIELMKWDMGGGGTTLGAARAIGQLKPAGVEIHFIMPAVLNLISDTAYLPGDIITASNGKTIEVINTDAEGRLCLCDALIYAEQTVGGMDAIVDIATLTGACIIALGNGIAGFWTPSDKLAAALTTASEGTPDKLWRMPLPEEYAEQLKSKIADLRNIGVGRAAGSITAALFLKEFVKTTEWAHIDIAGTAWSDKAGSATGSCVRTLVKWAETYSK